MPVDQQRGRARNIGAFPPDDGMRFAAQVLDIATPDAFELGADPIGGGAAIVVVSGKRRDGRNSQEFVQLAEQSVAIHGGGNVDTRLAASQRVVAG